MNKKTLIIILALLALIAGGVASFLILGNKAKKGVSQPQSAVNISGEEELEGDLQYQDASGFSFSYSKGVKVTDDTPEDDDSYYTLLTLSKGGKTLTISIKDTSFKNLDEWSKSQNDYNSPQLSGAATLGGISARQYAVGSSLITVAIDQGVVYILESAKDGDFWEDLQNLVVSSFSFSSGSAKTSSGSSTDIIYEEEVVE